MLKNVKSSMVISGLLFILVATSSFALTQTRCAIPSNKPGVAAKLAPCDFSFTSIPTYTCGGALPQAGIYTIRNNSPVTIAINYIRIKNNDANPAGDVAITSTTCGTTLASGSTCNVTVSLATDGPFSRTLQVGLDTRQVEINSPIITPTSGCNIPSPPSPSLPCALGSTSTFATLAGAGITNTGLTLLNGDLGLSPGTAVTGFPPGTVNGTQHISDSTAAAAQLDLTSLYTCLAAQPCTTVIGTGDQAGTTLTSAGVGAVNVYCSGSSILNSGVMTLSGDATSVFIFQAGSSLTFNPTSSVVLTGGVLASNVFWQVGSSATLGTSSVFNGTLAAFTSITMNTGATMVGRALARNGAVTFDTNTVNLP